MFQFSIHSTKCLRNAGIHVIQWLSPLSEYLMGRAYPCVSVDKVGIKAPVLAIASLRPGWFGCCSSL